MEDVHTVVYIFYSLGGKQVLHDSVMDRTVFLIPFQYIAASLSPWDGYARGAGDSGDTTSLHAIPWLWYYEPTYITYATFVFNKLKL